MLCLSCDYYLCLSIVIYIYNERKIEMGRERIFQTIKRRKWNIRACMVKLNINILASNYKIQGSKDENGSKYPRYKVHVKGQQRFLNISLRTTVTGDCVNIFYQQKGYVHGRGRSYDTRKKLIIFFSIDF